MNTQREIPGQALIVKDQYWAGKSGYEAAIRELVRQGFSETQADNILHPLGGFKGTYPTEIKIWSRIGNTPITKRGSSYCDLLVDTVVECGNPEEALAMVKEIIKACPHGDYGHFHMPTYWNQNTRSSFTH